MRPAVYTKKTIVDAALELIRDQGAEKFSMRNVAKHLKCSTQPIYSCFKDGRELYEMVLQEIKRRLIANTKVAYTEYVFRNIGLGFTYFGRDNPNLFLALFGDAEINKVFVKGFLDDLRTALDTDSRFVKLSPGDKDILLEKMWTFSYGYTNIIIQGFTHRTSDGEIEEMIVGVGTAVIMDIMKGT